MDAAGVGVGGVHADPLDLLGLAVLDVLGEGDLDADVAAGAPAGEVRGFDAVAGGDAGGAAEGDHEVGVVAAVAAAELQGLPGAVAGVEVVAVLDPVGVDVVVRGHPVLDSLGGLVDEAVQWGAGAVPVPPGAGWSEDLAGESLPVVEVLGVEVGVPVVDVLGDDVGRVDADPGVVGGGVGAGVGDGEGGGEEVQTAEAEGGGQDQRE